MKKTLYLMRHGQTLFNQLGKIQGWCDSPLTELGMKQAKVAGKYFEEHNITFDHAYSSTAERSCDTLDIVTNGEMPYAKLKGLKEMNFGMFEGESEVLNPKGPHGYEDFFIPYGGEAAIEVEKRMVTTLTELMEKEDHHNVLAVSHNGACFYFLRACQDPNEELRIGFTNCCIFKYEYEDKSFKLIEIIRHKSI